MKVYKMRKTNKFMLFPKTYDAIADKFGNLKKYVLKNANQSYHFYAIRFIPKYGNERQVLCYIPELDAFSSIWLQPMTYQITDGVNYENI